MAERTAQAYELALVHLQQSPSEFWASTPSETADLLVAYRQRCNRDNLRAAWLLHHVIAPHVGPDADISVMRLFEAMPGSFPADLPKQFNADAAPSDMTPAQKAEWLRRRNKKRLTRPS